ncbi:MAG TPA: hypothetical protein VIS99_11230 [Terrimicrobiaceae bacterium]
MLQPVVIEDLARKAVDRAISGAKSEDSLIELKRELPEPRKAARQIAALCNAAPGEDACWVVGVGEDGSFVLQTEELANWLPQVSRYFDGTAPTCRVYNVNIEDKPLVLLHFHTVLRPFVVIRENGDREISWRAGNLTRSATRSEALSLLVPTITRPNFEIVNAHITLERPSNFLNVGMEIYIIPTNGIRLAMPLHKCEIHVESGGQSFSFPPATVSWYEPPGNPVNAPLQLIFERPAFFGFTARHHFDHRGGALLSEAASLLFSVGFAGSEVTALLEANPPQTNVNENVQHFSWSHPQWFVRR